MRHDRVVARFEIGSEWCNLTTFGVRLSVRLWRDKQEAKCAKNSCAKK
jgi:hypothetical protein